LVVINHQNLRHPATLLILLILDFNYRAT
jgi:hypothetical protein